MPSSPSSDVWAAKSEMHQQSEQSVMQLHHGYTLGHELSLHTEGVRYFGRQQDSLSERNGGLDLYENIILPTFGPYGAVYNWAPMFISAGVYTMIAWGISKWLLTPEDCNNKVAYENILVCMFILPIMIWNAFEGFFSLNNCESNLDCDRIFGYSSASITFMCYYCIAEIYAIVALVIQNRGRGKSLATSAMFVHHVVSL